MVDQNLLEKISKLLALASSPNEHEAALAMILLRSDLNILSIMDLTSHRWLESVTEKSLR